MTNAVDLNITLNKEKYYSGTSSQMAYMLIETSAISENFSSRSPVNLCLVMDRSASMKGDKLDNVKIAMLNIVETMNEKDFISVIVFNEDADVVIKSQPVENKENLKYLINDISYSGGTSISKGIELGLKELDRNYSENHVNRMLILTDGQTYGDEEICYKLARKANETGISITALGVGDEWHEEVLDTIAHENSGKSDYIATPDEIIPIFESEMKSIQSIITKNNEMKLRFVEGVTPRKINRVLPYISEIEFEFISDNTVQFDMGDMDQNFGHGFLLELVIEAKKSGQYRIAQAEYSFEILDKKSTKSSIRKDIVVNFSDDEIACKKINPTVMNIAEKASAYELQTRAIKQAAAGDISGATQRLRIAATRLLDMGENDLADAALDEINNLENAGSMSSSGTKKLKYETRKLTQRLSL